ncbi:MAG: hypothetical protein IKN72_01795 [Clostridia bacterium]|nr:hypothetical protein [Clostridia bacterium]
MKYSPEFLEANARLKTLDEETLNDALNEMTADELLAHGDYMIQQTIDEENRLSEEEEQAHISELLQLTREPSKDEIKPIKVHTHRTVKRIVILAAAILVLVSVFMASTIASKHDFSLFDGTVRFEDGKIHVLFSNGNGNDSTALTMAEFEAELKEHGIEEIKLPTYFYENDWMVTSSIYHQEDDINQVNVELSKNAEKYSMLIICHNESEFYQGATFFGVEGGETIQRGDTSVYLFDHGNALVELTYFSNNCEYRIQSTVSAEKMRMIANTIV